MLEQQEVESVQKALSEKRYDEAQKQLIQLNPVDIVVLLRELGEKEEALAFRLLPKDKAVAVFEQMEPKEQGDLLATFHTGAAGELFRELSPDDQVRLLDEVPAMVARRLVQSLEPADRQQTLQILGYAEGTAGRYMTPDFVELRRDMTVGQALERIRRQAPRKETIYVVYVIDDQRQLVGVASLRDLVIATSDQMVGSIMTTDVKFAYTSTDREEAARTLQDYDLLAVPVVDREERLVGIITWDDVMDILEEETTEDIYHMAGMGVVEHADSPLLQSASRRIPWLVFNMAWAFLGAYIIGLFEHTIAVLTAVAIFIPIIAGQAGNAGIQTATITIRSLALGELEGGHVIRRVLLKEWGLGLIKGTLFGSMLTAVAWIWQENLALGVVAGASLFLNMIVASTAGVILPFAARHFHLDPATVAGVFNTMLTDFFGFLIYLGLATLFLHLLIKPA